MNLHQLKPTKKVGFKRWVKSFEKTRCVHYFMHTARFFFVVFYLFYLMCFIFSANVKVYCNADQKDANNDAHIPNIPIIGNA